VLLAAGKKATTRRSRRTCSTFTATSTTSTLQMRSHSIAALTESRGLAAGVSPMGLEVMGRLGAAEGTWCTIPTVGTGLKRASHAMPSASVLGCTTSPAVRMFVPVCLCVCACVRMRVWVWVLPYHTIPPLHAALLQCYAAVFRLLFGHARKFDGFVDVWAPENTVPEVNGLKRFKGR
jgi:hypothetical protein